MTMPPTPPPVRTTNNHYHFHTYDFAGAQPWGLSGAVATSNNWQFYSMVADLTGLSRYGQHLGVPNIARTHVGGFTVNGTANVRETLMLSFGNLGSVAGRPTVVITGGIHAREWIASEIAYLIAEYLIKNYPAGHGPLTRYQKQLKKLVDTRNIHIIPMINPDGNHWTVFGANARMWRKNCRPLPLTPAAWVAAPLAAPPFQNVQAPPGASAQYDVPDYDGARHVPPGQAQYQTRQLANGRVGVDLNRNMAARAWGYDTPGGSGNYHCWDPSDDQYFGPRPGSEAETANVQTALAYVAHSGIATSIDYHSYGCFILYPTETSYNAPIGPDYTALGKALNDLIPDYSLGSPKELVGYDATGSVADYAAQRHQARAFTIELDPDTENPGFELPEDRIRRVFEKNICAALVAIAAPPRSSRYRKRAISQSLQQFLDWDVTTRGNQLPV